MEHFGGVEAAGPPERNRLDPDLECANGAGGEPALQLVGSGWKATWQAEIDFEAGVVGDRAEDTGAAQFAASDGRAEFFGLRHAFDVEADDAGGNGASSACIYGVRNSDNVGDVRRGWNQADVAFLGGRCAGNPNTD